MISISDLTVSYGGFTLLDSINFHISDKEKIGLVGKNGAGKSTILKLIMGIQSPTSGKVSMPSDRKVGYLPQIMKHARGKSVIDEAMTAFAEHNELNMRMDRISHELANRSDYESEEYHKLIVELNDITDRLRIYPPESPRVQAEKILIGLGFRQGELDRMTSTFSHGWNMRIELAKILLQNPDILLLDAPTNHLDIESIQWLEEYLKSFSGAMVLISHDRRFLDNCTNRTVEVMLGKIHDYKVPYSQFVELRKERIAQQRAAYENQQRMIEKTEEFIEKFRYKPTKSNQVQSRIKQLEKIERIEIDEEDLSTINVRFPSAPRSGDVVFSVKDATIGYSKPKKKIVLSRANMTIRRGEKVAFVGRNGEGKTTVMRLLTGQLQPFEGEVVVGYNVKTGYFAQNQEDLLDKKDTVYGTLDKVAVGEVRTRLRDILGAFLFRGEDIDKKVAVLSGGERSRLAMAKLILHPYNLLALDEPTNHMDLRSKDVLKQALQKYDGTLIIVSHDRDFLDGLVEKIYEFANGQVKEHLGGVDDFLYRKKISSLREIEIKKQPPSQAAPEPKKEKTSTYEEQKYLSREERKMKNRQQRLENEISSLEEEISEVEKILSSPSPEDDIVELTHKYNDLKINLENKMDEWASLTID
ncbi:MAG: ABC-F family ATP-binding cassette domain-containing protein [Bacteroidales bacterium]|nr:ABC-F family ATP-binding cassette domain-containing protein [Bacteroidales bacterium]